MLLLAYISDRESKTDEATQWMKKFANLNLPYKPPLQIVQNTDKETFDAFQHTFNELKEKYLPKR